MLLYFLMPVWVLVLNKALVVSTTAVQLYWEPLDSLVVVRALSRSQLLILEEAFPARMSSDVLAWQSWLPLGKE